MNRRLHARVASASVAGVLVLVGCGGPEPETLALVTVTDRGFEPAAITVRVGDEVRWVNHTAGRVTVTSLDPAVTENQAGMTAPTTATSAPGGGAVEPDGAPGQRFDSGALIQGEAFAVRMEQSGRFVYGSVYQEDLHWYGTITVEGP